MSDQASVVVLPKDGEGTQVCEDPRVTQALEEYLTALEAGPLPDRKQFLARHPDIAPVLGEYLEGLDFLHRTAAKMQASSGVGLGNSASAKKGPEPVLEDYHIVREIGRGGMGIVYEARQRSLQRQVALKVMPLGATLDPRHLQRFKNEAQAAAQLQHPHIVPVFAVGCEQGVHYYAMRFIEGRTLAEFIAYLRDDRRDRVSGSAATDSHHVQSTSPKTEMASKDALSSAVPPLPSPLVGNDLALLKPGVRDHSYFRQTAWLGVQAAEALEYAHQMGVIHRDIKPANLLLDRQGQLWVTDFGLARWLADDALTMTGDMVGTLRYMSPEQATARRGLVDHRTDVYSLGATLYEMATWEPVCRGSDHRELLQEILHEDPVPPRRWCGNIPRDLETILLKALGKGVEERYATAQEMADDLRRFLDDKPVQARRPGLWERAGKWALRHRPLVVSACVLLLLSVLGLTAGTIVVGREQAETKRAYEKEKEAVINEGSARARAEENFRQARQLLDSIAEIAVVDMETDAEMRNVRRKLLRAALSYYKDFIEQQKDNKLARDELVRGYTRVATILEAIGQEKDARLAWNQALMIAYEPLDTRTVSFFHLLPASNKLRLLQDAAVQADLKLTVEEARAVGELEAKRNQPSPASEQNPNARARSIEEEAIKLLKPQQANRLNQLLLQQAGIWSFQDAAVSAALQLTPRQREDLAAIQKNAQANRGAPGKPDSQDNKAAMDRILGLLSDEQKARWREQVGTPFAGVLPPRDVFLSAGTGTFAIKIVSAHVDVGPTQAILASPAPGEPARK